MTLSLKKTLFLGFLLIFSLPTIAQEQPNDCVNAITVCGNDDFMSNASGSGQVQEVSSCSSGENNSIWLEINIAQSGTLGFDLIPSNTNLSVDYDFFVFGPNSDCSNLGNTIRCSTTNPIASGQPTNHTGMNGAETDNQEGPGQFGNSYVSWLDVQVGESYFIVIDRPIGNGGFEIQWTGSASENGGAFPEPPEANMIDDLTACSSVNNPNTATFNLDALRTDINNDLTSNSVDFFLSMANAIDNDSALPDNYTTTASSQQVYAKVTSTATGCFSIIDFNLQVSPTPEVSVSVSSNDICLGEEVRLNLTGTPDAVVTYTLNAGADQQINLNNSGMATIRLSPAEDITLEFQVVELFDDSNVSNCSQPLSETISVSVNTVMTPQVTNNSPFCEGEAPSLIFSGEPNATISYRIENGGLLTFDLDTSGEFTLELPGMTAITDVTIESITSSLPPFCHIDFNITETITLNPKPTIASEAVAFCSTDAQGFFDFDLAAEIPEILGDNQSPSEFTVLFYEDAAANQANQITTNPYTNTTEFNQVIYVEITEEDTSCSSLFPFELAVGAKAIATAPETIAVCDSDGVSDGITSFDLTALDAEILNDQDPDDFSVSYYTTTDDAENGENPIEDPENFRNTSPNNQTIFIRVINNNISFDCFSTTSFEFIVRPIIEPVIFSEDGSNTICVDFETNELQNEITLTSDFQDEDYTYVWYLDGTKIPEANQPTYTVDTAAPGLYTVSISEIQFETNCNETLSESFEISQSGPATLIDIVQSEAFQNDAKLIIVVEGFGDYLFQLDDGPIVDNDGIFTGVVGGLHTVHVYDRKTENPSCGVLEIDDIRVIDYPKFFTPNNDGFNDTWNIPTLNLQDRVTISIFDRYGKLLKQISPSSSGWNGTFNGRPVPSSDYWFVVEYEESGEQKQFKAHFTLKR